MNEEEEYWHSEFFKVDLEVIECEGGSVVSLSVSGVLRIPRL